jgi:cytochrome c oxidase accessory protein FixG
MSLGLEREAAEAVNSKQARSLYAARVKIHPKAVHGFFRRLKWAILGFALAVYYVLPWLRYDRGDHAPDQAVLADLAGRRFYFFFIEIWPQEFYYVAGLLIMAGVGLFLVTSVVGRAWCGHACPQTVWTDLFMKVEEWIEGDRNARMRLDKASWGFSKIFKRVSKNFVWLLIALATGGAWIFYFADAPTLAQSFVNFTAPPVAYFTVATLTATTFVFAGYMREQVCTYMCPWPRIQGAMLDEDSLIVTYNAWRGEPRSGHRKRVGDAPVGDCIDCNACVAVCPMGIDIRDGNQLECISCALCIDACDNVMEKVGAPKSLISYSTLRSYNASAAGHPVKPNWHVMLRPRTLIYAGLWSLIGVVMVVSLLMRDRLALDVVPDRNPLFVTLSDGSIRNGYTVKILNMEGTPRRFLLVAEGLPGARLSSPDLNQLKGDGFEIPVEADKLRSVKVYIEAPRQELRGASTDFILRVTEVTDEGEPESSVEQAIFHGPQVKE